MNPLILILVSSFLFIAELNLNAQTTRKVLFLGNSYTGVNNLPQIIHDVALSAGDTLVFDSYTPGGYKLIDHNNDITSKNKIMTGGWDYVVIQGQSQEPIILYSQFINGGIALANLIKQHNPCAVVMPYMTWGRKNGDALNCANFLTMCTYQGMDTTLRRRYLDLTNFISGEVSPVSVVWNYLRQHHPNIELYQTDESHPSIAGSYAAACCFYTAIFKKDPTLINFNFGLNAIDAANIKNAVKTQIFDHITLWDFKKQPRSDFKYQIGSGTNEIILTPINQIIGQTYFWDFGDGTTSSIPNPTHSYLSNGTYTVSLTTTNCDPQGINTSFSDTVIQFCSHTPTIYTSHPWLCNYDTLWTQTADAYQWILNGTLLPETQQYLPNYFQYGLSGFSVISTLNGCAELSEISTETPLWSGYFFDALPVADPCIGDTVPFAVLHTNGFLSGFEHILWFKNDTLLPLMTNKDTLFINAGGRYECKVINPNSDCPSDTTSALIVFDCETVGIVIEDTAPKLSWSIFPNPASENIIIKFTGSIINEQIQIYNAIGHLIKVVKASETMEIPITDLANGIYYIRLKNNKQPPLKFIKL